MGKAMATLTVVALTCAGSPLTLAYLTAATDTSTCTLSGSPIGGADLALTPAGRPPNPAAGRYGPAQLANARLIIAVARQQDLPARAAVIAVATALQESALHNLPDGDRDSAGLFQQRPSAGWGTHAQVTDPVHAATSFYAHLIRIPGWPRLPLTIAAQAVQHSAHPDAYARWEPTATALVHALAQPGTPFNTCGVDDPPNPTSADPPAGLQPQAMGADGLTAHTRRVRDLVAADFNVHDIGGYCPGGCTSGHIPGSDHYTGHAIDIMLTPVTPTRQALGNRIATWAVANAGPLAIKYVIWNAHIWAANRAQEGWRPYRHPSGHTNPTLEHRDHVHVSVY